MTGGEEQYARLAARVLRESLPQRQTRTGDVRRDSVIAAVALAIVAKVRRRRLVRGTGVLLAVAAGLLLFVRWSGTGDTTTAPVTPKSTLVVEKTSGQGNYLIRETTTRPLLVRGVLAVGDAVQSGKNSNSMLGFSNGTRISLESSSKLRVDDLGETRRFSLTGGRLRVAVAKLSPGERFIVDTPDSEVEVRGTTFSVAVNEPPRGCQAGTGLSTIDVEEGTVWVRTQNKQVILHAGESWTGSCVVAEYSAIVSRLTIPNTNVMNSASPIGTGSVVAHRAPALQASTLTAQRPSDRSISTAPPEYPPLSATAILPAPSLAEVPPVRVSHLAEQNDLLAAAMAAERQSQYEVALHLLNDLINRYPTSPLRETAWAERTRVLSAQAQATQQLGAEPHSHVEGLQH